MLCTRRVGHMPSDVRMYHKPNGPIPHHHVQEYYLVQSTSEDTVNVKLVQA